VQKGFQFQQYYVCVLFSPQPTGSSGRGATASTRPRRENRKLPAHLADPNYVQLEAGDGDVDMEDREAKSTRRESQEANDQDNAGDEGENNEEDDPNK